MGRQMTVRRLITALKKMPQDAKVGFATHDQNYEAGEYDGIVSGVGIVPPEARHHGCAVMIHG